MNSLLSPEYQAVYTRFIECLRELDPSRFSSEQTFPKELWASLCAEGLLATTSEQTTHSAQQQGTVFRDFAIGAYAVSQYSRSLGLAMTTIGQQLKLHFLNTLGTNAVHRKCSGQISKGDALCALAISEPDAGAHPKHLSCTASRDGNDYLITGDKTYVTHGPYADWFILLAITELTNKGKSQGKKEFSAFLLPRNTPGLTIETMAVNNGLEPVTHANLQLNQCRVAKENLLGKPGIAFDEISKPMRTLEDVLMLCAIAGRLQGELDQLTPTGDSKGEMAELGNILCLTEAATKLGIIAAEALDHSGYHSDPLPLVIGFRTLASEAATQLRKHVVQNRADCVASEAVFKDIEVLMKIGSGATGLKVAKLAQERYAREP